jgi:hypothetical protein
MEMNFRSAEENSSQEFEASEAVKLLKPSH